MEWAELGISISTAIMITFAAGLVLLQLSVRFGAPERHDFSCESSSRSLLEHDPLPKAGTRFSRSCFRDDFEALTL
jgi:hypothetical protein